MKSSLHNSEAPLNELNRKFVDRELVGTPFYEQLMSNGFLYQKSVLLEFFPDGDNTYCGVIVRQDNRVFKFDVDLDCPQYSSFADVTETEDRKLLSKSIRRDLKKMGV